MDKQEACSEYTEKNENFTSAEAYKQGKKDESTENNDTRYQPTNSSRKTNKTRMRNDLSNEEEVTEETEIDNECRRMAGDTKALSPLVCQNYHNADANLTSNEQEVGMPYTTTMSLQTNPVDLNTDETAPAKMCGIAEIDHIQPVSLQPDKQDNFLMNPDILTSAMQSLVRSPDFSFFSSVTADASNMKGPPVHLNYISEDPLTQRHFQGYSNEQPFLMADNFVNTVQSSLPPSRSSSAVITGAQECCKDDLPTPESHTSTLGLQTKENKVSDQSLTLAEYAVDQSNSFKGSSVSSTSPVSDENHFIPEQAVVCDKVPTDVRKTIPDSNLNCGTGDNSGYYYSFSNMCFHKQTRDSMSHLRKADNSTNVANDQLHTNSNTISHINWETEVNNSGAEQNRAYNTLPDMSTFSNSSVNGSHSLNSAHETAMNYDGSYVGVTHGTSTMMRGMGDKNNVIGNTCGGGSGVYLNENSASHVHCCQRHYQSPGNPLACSTPEILQIHHNAHNHHLPCNAAYANPGQHNNHSCCYSHTNSSHCCPGTHGPINNCTYSCCSPRGQTHSHQVYSSNNNSCSHSHQQGFGYHLRNCESEQSCKTHFTHGSRCQSQESQAANIPDTLSNQTCNVSALRHDAGNNESTEDIGRFSSNCDTRCHSNCNLSSEMSEPACSSEKYARRYNLRQSKSEDKLIKKKRPRQRYYKRPLMSNSSTSDGTKNVFDPQFAYPPPSFETNVSKKELICRYVDYLVQENECLTQLSKTFIVPSDLLVTEEMYRYVLRIAFETKIRFPTAKFLQWVRKFYPRLEIQSTDFYCLNSFSFPFTKSLEGKHNEEILEEMFFYFQRKKIQCSAVK